MVVLIIFTPIYEYMDNIVGNVDNFESIKEGMKFNLEKKDKTWEEKLYVDIVIYGEPLYQE